MAEFIKIQKPDLSEVDRTKVYKNFIDDEEKMMPFIEKGMNPNYLAWEDFKHRPLPQEVTGPEMWTMSKLVRKIRSTDSFIRDENGLPFTWMNLDRFARFLHEIDMETGGNLFLTPEYSQTVKERSEEFVTKGIMEEAIASSQLEGAHMTREKAKRMIREGRKPVDIHEQMILNNYRTIEKIEEIYKNQPMSVDLIFTLHRMLMEGTDIKESKLGRFRTDADEIDIGDDAYATIAHIPPSDEFLIKEIERFVSISNDNEEGQFLHPVVKAIFLHFWIGWLHPFVDGNGRLARAVFYWYLLRKGYWAFMYLPISVRIKNSRKRYDRAYLYTEQDDNDLTYFLDYNLEIIMKTVDGFRDYVARKIKERRQVQKILSDELGLNRRQKDVITFVSAHPNEFLTIKGHKSSHGVTRVTARKDLYDLVDRGFLSAEKFNKRFVRFRIGERLQ